jgi:iron-sulfur cluster repair protein YtfE (RIC family)
MLKMLTQPIRDEHKELMPHVESLLRAGDALYEGMLTEIVCESLDKAQRFLTEHLLIHAEAEDRVLYPIVQRIMGSPLATETMSYDHKEVQSLTQQLAMLRSQILSTTISRENANSLRRVLYGLYALVKVHIAKEEEVYFPLLDLHLKPAEAEKMFKDMEAATLEAEPIRQMA